MWFTRGNSLSAVGYLSYATVEKQWSLAATTAYCFRAGKQEKILPSAVVREELEAKRWLKSSLWRTQSRTQKNSLTWRGIASLHCASKKRFQNRTTHLGNNDLKQKILVSQQQPSQAMTEQLQALTTTAWQLHDIRISSTGFHLLLFNDGLGWKNEVPAQPREKTVMQCEIQRRLWKTKSHHCF